MALNITNSSFAGQEAGKYISAALLSASTLDNGLVDIRENVKYRQVIQKLSTGSLVQDASCDFNADGDVQLDEIVLLPREYMVNLKMCTKELADSWESVQMGASAHDDELPSTFEDYLIGRVAEKVAIDVEDKIWNQAAATIGGTAYAGGILTQLGAASETITVAGSRITPEEAIVALGNAADDVPNTIYGADDLVLAVSPDIFRAYKRALGGFQSNGQGAAGVDSKGFNQDINVEYFDGIKVVMINALGTSKIVAYQTSNIFFGTGLLSDHNEVRVMDMAPLDGSQNVQLVMRFTAGVTIGFANEIVYHSA